LGLQGHAILHDFGVTRKHYVVHQAPSSINSIALSLGLQPPMTCISYAESRDGAFHVVARNGGEPRTVVAPGSGFLLQIANTFDDKESGAIIVDAIEMPRLPLAPAPADGSWKDQFDFAKVVYVCVYLYLSIELTSSYLYIRVCLCVLCVCVCVCVCACVCVCVCVCVFVCTRFCMRT
jgi:hypothetical protein